MADWKQCRSGASFILCLVWRIATAGRDWISLIFSAQSSIGWRKELHLAQWSLTVRHSLGVAGHCVLIPSTLNIRDGAIPKTRTASNAGTEVSIFDTSCPESPSRILLQNRLAKTCKSSTEPSVNLNLEADSSPRSEPKPRASSANFEAPMQPSKSC